MSKILTVFGATGNQGGSVIKAILADAVLSKEYKIRGVTRDTSKPASQALAAKGVEMVSVRLLSPFPSPRICLCMPRPLVSIPTKATRGEHDATAAIPINRLEELTRHRLI